MWSADQLRSGPKIAKPEGGWSACKVPWWLPKACGPQTSFLLGQKLPNLKAAGLPARCLGGSRKACGLQTSGLWGTGFNPRDSCSFLQGSLFSLIDTCTFLRTSPIWTLMAAPAASRCGPLMAQWPPAVQGWICNVREALCAQKRAACLWRSLGCAGDAWDDRLRPVSVPAFEQVVHGGVVGTEDFQK